MQFNEYKNNGNSIGFYAGRTLKENNGFAASNE
jgi:hypothetical protein